MKKFRVLNWNLGLAFFYKYWKFFGLKLNGQKVYHEYFQKQYVDFVVSTILEIKPDLCILEEFYKNEDIGLLTSNLKEIYPHFTSIPAWYHKHSILVLSKETIHKEQLNNTLFFRLKTNGLWFIPVHFNSFHSNNRLRQVNSLLEEVKTEPVDFVVGDTNFYNFTKSNFSLFFGDKMAYKKILSDFIDATKTVGHTSRLYMNFDKIFIKKGINFENPQCVYKIKKGMDHYPVYVDLVL